MEETLEDWQLALLVEARRKDDPVVVEANEADALRESKDLREQADGLDTPTVVERRVKEQHDEAEALLDEAQGIDEWEVVDKEQREAELEACEAVRDLLTDPLKEQNGLRDTVVDSMGVSDMVEQFREEGEDGEIKLESLSQQPETGGAGEDEIDDSDDPEEQVDSLSADERREVETKLDRASKMENRTPEYAESLRQQAADIVGVDDADDINVEAL